MGKIIDEGRLSRENAHGGYELILCGGPWESQEQVFFQCKYFKDVKEYIRIKKPENRNSLEHMMNEVIHEFPLLQRSGPCGRKEIKEYTSLDSLEHTSLKER